MDYSKKWCRYRGMPDIHLLVMEKPPKEVKHKMSAKKCPCLESTLAESAPALKAINLAEVFLPSAEWVPAKTSMITPQWPVITLAPVCIINSERMLFTRDYPPQKK